MQVFANLAEEVDRHGVLVLLPLALLHLLHLVQPADVVGAAHPGSVVMKNLFFFGGASKIGPKRSIQPSVVTKISFAIYGVATTN